MDRFRNGDAPGLPTYVVLAPHWSLPDSTARPHIATPGELWPVPSQIALCGAGTVGPDLQRAGTPDEACDACQTALAARPDRAYVAQGPRTCQVAIGHDGEEMGRCGEPLPCSDHSPADEVIAAWNAESEPQRRAERLENGTVDMVVDGAGRYVDARTGREDPHTRRLRQIEESGHNHYGE